MKTITTLITERDFNSLRLGKRLEIIDKKEDIKVILKYLKNDKSANPATEQGIY